MIAPDTAVFLKGLIASTVLPPWGLLFIATLALLWVALSRRRKPKLVWLAMLCLGSFMVLTSPPVSRWLAKQVEHLAGPALDKERIAALAQTADAPKAIVVLGGGMSSDVREFPYPNRPTPVALERVLAAARIARWSGLPVLTSGGAPKGRSISEAQVLARILTKDFNVPVRWQETASLDTADNARFSADLLKRQGIGHVILITHAAHIPRAQRAFEAAGLKVTAAPVSFQAAHGIETRLRLLPNGRSVSRADYAVHEIIGMVWYAWQRRLAGSNEN